MNIEQYTYWKKAYKKKKHMVSFGKIWKQEKTNNFLSRFVTPGNPHHADKKILKTVYILFETNRYN